MAKHEGRVEFLTFIYPISLYLVLEGLRMEGVWEENPRGRATPSWWRSSSNLLGFADKVLHSLSCI